MRDKNNGEIAKSQMFGLIVGLSKNIGGDGV